MTLSLYPTIIERDLFIAGEWQPAAQGKRIERYSPVSGELIGRFALASADDARRAVQAARQAFDHGPWPRMDPAERAEIMLRTADLLQERQEELANWESKTTGTPLRFTRNFVTSAVKTFRYFAGLARTIKGSSFGFTPSRLGFTLKEPVGVVSLILPWNFPLGEATWKVCPALAAGCTMIVKPDTKTPVTALALGPILQEAGLPDGVYNVITGEPAEISDIVTADPAIDHISFTGSTHSGRIIMSNASNTLKPLHLELGGKSPLIIFEDSDVDAAAQDAAFGIFWHCGQVCTASSRLLVQQSISNAFVDRLTHHAQAMQIGDPDDPETMLGPLVSEEHLSRVLAYVAKGTKEGAILHLGGERLNRPPFERGAYLPPTIFTGVENNMTIAQEEIFGPVAAVIEFQTEAEAVAIANDSSYGLGAGIWTRDIDRAMRVVRQLSAGSVWINGYGSERLEMPWGGYKQSGYGRELGEQGVEEFLQTKSVHVQIRGNEIG